MVRVVGHDEYTLQRTLYRRACIPPTSLEIANVRVSVFRSTIRCADIAINSATAHAEAKQITSP
jgi:hypothetical protein